MKLFDSYIREWEKNAEKDAYWAVLTSSQYETKAWDREAFFNSGRKEIAILQEYIEKQNLPVNFQGKALDFGCGVGRLTQALAPHFSEVYGIDISLNMIQEAKKALPYDLTTINFVHNPAPDLGLFASHSFDFIYSNIVLQHISRKHQRRYLKEFARLMKPKGWIIIQVPSKRVYSSIKSKIKGEIANLLPYQLRKKLLILLGNNSRAIKEFDFEINTCSKKWVEKYAQDNGLKIRHIAYTNSCETDFSGNLTFTSYEQASSSPGYISPMYFLQK